MKKLISFFEIPAADFPRAVKFYETILDLQLSVYECESEKMAFFPEENGKATGAVSWADSGFTPSKDGVLIHFEVEDMEAALDKITGHGGRITRPRTKIECDGAGYFATFLDSEGNQLGLHSEN